MALRTILAVDDDRAMGQLLLDGLAHQGFAVTACTSAAEALEWAGRQEFDAVVTDLRLGAMDGHALCRRLKEQDPDLPVVVITGFGSVEAAVEAMRAGAYDFLQKPVKMDVLAMALRRASDHRALHREVRRLRRTVERGQGFGDLVGRSPAMQQLFEMVDRLGTSDASVLITGESGTGKELVARRLHVGGPRGGKPFLALNCAALPESLLESELFGHARGAFTDAKSARPGLLVEADGGTLFLDEVGDMPLALQPKLLRALQERTVRPLGAREEVPFDVRVVSATHRDLEADVAEGRFREDLFFRLNVVQLELPPLRARGEDMLLLADHFLRRYAERAGREVPRLPTAVSSLLLAYPWPGNVRELQNAMERAVALSEGPDLRPDDLPPKVANFKPSHVLITADDPTELVTLEEMERRYILRVLESLGGNKTLAARALGVDRTTLYRKLERLRGVVPPG